MSGTRGLGFWEILPNADQSESFWPISEITWDCGIELTEKNKVLLWI